VLQDQPAADLPGGAARLAGPTSTIRRSTPGTADRQRAGQSLYAYNPSLCCSTTTSAAGILRNQRDLQGNLTKAGYPVNFWVVNPDVTAASSWPTVHRRGTRIQLSLNRRFSGGVQVQAYYTYGKGYQQDFYSFSKPWEETEQTYTNRSASAATSGTPSPELVYELPFGQGKRSAATPGRP